MQRPGHFKRQPRQGMLTQLRRFDGTLDLYRAYPMTNRPGLCVQVLRAP